MTIGIRRILATTGAALLFAVAAIGIVRAATTAPLAPAAPDRVAAAAPAVVSGPSAADPDPSLGDELDAVLAADQSAAPATNRAGAIARGRLRRLAASRQLVHATVVVDLAKGGLTTIQLDHGTISAVGPTSLTIAESGGGSVTVTLGAETRVRRAGAKAAVADLKASDEVFVMSKIESGATTAYLVVVPKA